MKKLFFSKSRLLTTLVGSSLLAAGAAVPLAVTAADGPAGKSRFPISIAELEAKGKARFDSADADGNGALSMSEFEATGPDLSRMREHRPPRPHSDSWGHRPGAHRGPMDKAHAGAHPDRKQRDQMRKAIEAEMFNILDADDNGQLSAEEFAAGSRPENHQLALKRAMFKHLDRNEDGQLTPEELPDRIAHLKAADSDGDGSITAEEMRAHRKALGRPGER